MKNLKIWGNKKKEVISRPGQITFLNSSYYLQISYNVVISKTEFYSIL